MTGKGSSAEAELHLHCHFSGKRAGVRVPKDLEVVLRVSGLGFVARTIDISRSGMLLKLESGMAEEGVDLPYFALRVQCYFAEGCDVTIVKSETAARARVIRATEQDGQLLLAFQFEEPLPDSVCEELGIPVDAVDPGPQPEQ